MSNRVIERVTTAIVAVGQVIVGQITGTVTTIPQVVGDHANAWDNAATGAGGFSNSVDCRYTPFVSAFGHVSAATTIMMQLSQDNVNFYDAANMVLAGASDFDISRTVGARYVRLKSSANVTATATIAGKD